MLSEQEIVQHLDDIGHLKMPFNEAVQGPWPTHALDVDSKEVRTGLESFQAMYQPVLETIKAKLEPTKNPRFAVTGDLDDATVTLLNTARCQCPDYYPGAAEAVGSGNWPKCWGVGDFHRAIVSVVTSAIPDFLKPVWENTKALCTQAYREVGLDIVFKDNEPSQYNTQLTFVKPDGGWIGLAIVGQNQKCSDKIWLRLDKGYQPANIASEWLTLLKHELGHNCGLQHSTGGVMNPYIIKGLPVSWKGDVSEPSLKARFGGVPYVPAGTPQPAERDLIAAWRYADGRIEVISVIDDGTPNSGPWQV
jgi:hypothetical protein